jgi:hypothetical protein
VRVNVSVSSAIRIFLFKACSLSTSRACSGIKRKSRPSIFSGFDIVNFVIYQKLGEGSQQNATLLFPLSAPRSHQTILAGLCYHSRLPDPLPIVKYQLQLSLVTQVSCLGGSGRGRVAVFNLRALRADDPCHRPDLA